MTFVAVASGMISIVGYDAELNHLQAIMRDGAVYDVSPCTQSEYDAFMKARSAGIYWNVTFRHRAVRSGKDESKIKPALQTFAPDPCCSKPLSKAIRGGTLDKANSWTCPNCGCDWKPKLVGTVRHWEPEVLAVVMRL